MFGNPDESGPVTRKRFRNITSISFCIDHLKMQRKLIIYEKMTSRREKLLNS